MFLQCCATHHDDQSDLVQTVPKDGNRMLHIILQRLGDLSVSQQRIENGNMRIEQALEDLSSKETKVNGTKATLDCSLASFEQPIEHDDRTVVLAASRKTCDIPMLRSASNASFAPSMVPSVAPSQLSVVPRRSLDSAQEAMQTFMLPDSWPSSIALRHAYGCTVTEGDAIQVLLSMRINDADALPIRVVTHSESDSGLEVGRESAGLRNSGAGDISWSRSLSTRMSASYTGSHLLAKSGMGAERRVAFRSKRLSCCVLNPSSTSRLLLDVVSILALTYDMFSIPFLLAWDIEVSPQSWLHVMFWTTCIFWTIDVFFSFRTGFFKSGELELRPAKIAKKYLRSWFLPDITVVLGDWTNLIIPMFTAETSDMETMKLLRFTKVSRLLRLFGFMRMAKVKAACERVFDTQLSEHHGMFIQIPPLLFVVLWVNHLIGCAWFAIGRSAASDTGRHWIDEMVARNATNTYRTSGRAYQYATALHWALTQMTPGSMQVSPMNTWERAYNNLCLVLGVLFFGSLVSLITSKMTQAKLASEQRSKSISSLRRFLLQGEFPKELRDSVIHQARSRMAKKINLTINDVPALTLLSSSLRNELRYQLFKPAITSRHPFFFIIDAISGHVMHRLCVDAVTNVVHSKGDNLFLAGADAENAYLLRHGYMRYIQDPSSSKIFTRHCVNVDPAEWICEAALWTHWIHVGTVECLTTSELLEIDSTKFNDAIRRHGVIKQFAREYARSFHRRLTNSKILNGCLPSDIRKPFTDFNELFFTMPKDVKVFIGLLTLQLMHRSSWFSRLNRKILSDLQSQVLDGKCTLGLDEGGKVVRVVAVTALELRDTDGRIFAHVGQIRDDMATGGCKLPGIKQKDDESSDDALATLIRQKLSPLADGIEITSSDVEVSTQESLKFSVSTKYLRTVYKAVLSEDFERPRSALFTATPTRGSKPWLSYLPDYGQVLIVKYGETSYVGAWLWQAQFEHLSSAVAESDLGSWIACMPKPIEDEPEKGNPKLVLL